MLNNTKSSTSVEILDRSLVSGASDEFSGRM